MHFRSILSLVLFLSTASTAMASVPFVCSMALPGGPTNVSYNGKDLRVTSQEGISKENVNFEKETAILESQPSSPLEEQVAYFYTFQLNQRFGSSLTFDLKSAQRARLIMNHVEGAFPTMKDPFHTSGIIEYLNSSGVVIGRSYAKGFWAYECVSQSQSRL